MRSSKTFIHLLLAVGALTLGQLALGQGQDLDRADGTLPLGTNASDGTLPLRLPSDGTLPLKLNGQAHGQAGTVQTRVTITSAQQAALSQAAGNAFRCQSEGDTISKHAATGSVFVGATSFTIKGICYNHVNKQMEVVAQRLSGATVTDQSFMVGVLDQPLPSELQGTLTVSGSVPHAGRYQFDLSREGE